MLLSVCMQCVWTVCLFAAVRRARLWATCAVLLLLHVLHVRCLEELEPVSLCYKKKKQKYKKTYHIGMGGMVLGVLLLLLYADCLPLLLLARCLSWLAIIVVVILLYCANRTLVFQIYLYTNDIWVSAGITRSLGSLSWCVCVCVCAVREIRQYTEQRVPRLTPIYENELFAFRAHSTDLQMIYTHTHYHMVTLCRFVFRHVSSINISTTD